MRQLFAATLVAYAVVLVAAFAPPPKPIILREPLRDVCAPYQTPVGEGLSCKPAGDVAAWILGERNVQSDQFPSLAAPDIWVPRVRASYSVLQIRTDHHVPLPMNIQRLHPQLKVTRTLSARLATSGFPVLGLPKHSAEGKRIRGLVRAPDGYVIGEDDYSQIELRVAAHLSGDKGMIDAFINGIDLHALTGHLVLNAPKEKEKQDESKHRLPSKAANFGYWMGLSPKGLTEQVHKAGNLEWSANCPGCKFYSAPHDDDCDSMRFFDIFNQQFPGAPKYQQDRMDHAVETGYGYGMWGEEWYLPGVWSPHDEVAEATKRQAFALPIQSGAQRLIKKAMRRVYSEDLPWARKQGAHVEILLQIHDALLWLAEKDFARQWHERVKRTMESVATWKVPIIAEGKYGPSWLEMEKIEQAA